MLSRILILTLMTITAASAEISLTQFLPCDVYFGASPNIKDVLTSWASLVNSTSKKMNYRFEESLSTVDGLIQKTQAFVDRGSESLIPKLEQLKSFRNKIQAGESFDEGDFIDTVQDLITEVTLSGKKVYSALSRDSEKSYHKYVVEYPTSAELTIKDLNDLSPYPIYPIGVVYETVRVDGRAMDPGMFFEHDVFHNIELRSRRDGYLHSFIKNGSENEFRDEIAMRVRKYAQFRKKVASLEQQADKDAYELAWFYLFHELSASMRPKNFALTLGKQFNATKASQKIISRIENGDTDLGAGLKDPKAVARQERLVPALKYIMNLFK